MKQPLVTILSPVYNGEKYISNFLDSVLEQDYKNIELILVNDGSSDNTDEVVKSYKKKLDSKLTRFKYIKQQNMGAAGAINTGLKFVEGKYLTWPDSDDILTKNSISMKVNFLEENKMFGFVRTNALAFKEGDLSKPIYIIKPKNKKQSKLFLNFLLDKNIYYCDGCYMVRMSSFKKVNKKMSIYVTKWGQNWQMFLPISYYEQCGYINKVGYCYIERDNSHSHNQKKYIDFVKKYNGYQDIIINVLKEMKLNENKKLINLVNIKYSHIRLELAVTYNKNDDFKKEYDYLKSLKQLTFKEKLYNKFSNKLLIQKLYSNILYIVNLPVKVIKKIVKLVNPYERV